jgi:hypothetical protein
MIIDKTSQSRANAINELAYARSVASTIQDYREVAADKATETLQGILDGSESQVNWNAKPRKSKEMEEDDYLICTPKVAAFNLIDKGWQDYILIDGLKEIEWTDDPYSALQLPDDNKSFIRALVDGFDTKALRHEYEDVIKGKGLGLTFLLHGAPGLGKTFTAGKVTQT